MCFLMCVVLYFIFRDRIYIFWKGLCMNVIKVKIYRICKVDFCRECVRGFMEGVSEVIIVEWVVVMI